MRANLLTSRRAFLRSSTPKEQFSCSFNSLNSWHFHESQYNSNRLESILAHSILLEVCLSNCKTRHRIVKSYGYLITLDQILNINESSHRSGTFNESLEHSWEVWIVKSNHGHICKLCTIPPYSYNFRRKINKKQNIFEHVEIHWIPTRIQEHLEKCMRKLTQKKIRGIPGTSQKIKEILNNQGNSGKCWINPNPGYSDKPGKFRKNKFEIRKKTQKSRKIRKTKLKVREQARNINSFWQVRRASDKYYLHKAQTSGKIR